VSEGAQAALGIVAFFGTGLVIAWALRAFGTAVFAIVIVALLALALALQGVIDSRWPAYAALGLAVLGAISRFALEAAVWSEERDGEPRLLRRRDRA
jgi:uncharacterized membrane protein (Fun14 family)